MTFKELLSAGEHFCSYQERSQYEVRCKLYDIGGKSFDIEQVIAQLIVDDFINEERFAKTIARGKFRLKNFGKRKIIQTLKFHKISPYCIEKALKEIDEKEYKNTIDKLLEKKLEQLKTEKNILVKKAKAYRYLLQKGFESQEIIKALDSHLK